MLGVRTLSLHPEVTPDERTELRGHCGLPSGQPRPGSQWGCPPAGGRPRGLQKIRRTRGNPRSKVQLCLIKGALQSSFCWSFWGSGRGGCVPGLRHSILEGPLALPGGAGRLHAPKAASSARPGLASEARGGRCAPTPHPRQPLVCLRSAACFPEVYGSGTLRHVRVVPLVSVSRIAEAHPRGPQRRVRLHRQALPITWTCHG